MAERCNRCRGELRPGQGVVPILACIDCGREIPAAALPAPATYAGTLTPAGGAELMHICALHQCPDDEPCTGGCRSLCGTTLVVGPGSTEDLNIAEPTPDMCVVCLELSRGQG